LLAKTIAAWFEWWTFVNKLSFDQNPTALFIVVAVDSAVHALAPAAPCLP